MSTTSVSNSNIDIQASSILQGLRKLGELLEEPVAREALDVNRNVDTSKHYDNLRRLRQSLQQYLGREGDLFYVGLLGHFSSGKSSTINSLLATWGTKQERMVDLHPTDTNITLITKEANAASLLRVAHEGHVAIRLQPIDNPLLDHLVIADTPGTGDPHLLQEIARDFLPICDVILFLFSAASPLDQTDLPLLAELHRRLPFIPIRFVITRADELRADFSQPISESNINPAARGKFLTDIMSRVNLLLKPTTYTEEHFLLIDNKSGYNIDALKSFLLAKCDPTNTSARISMHGNKLNFYLSGAKDLREFFASFLEKKLEELNKIVTAAERNIRSYNEIVRISNNNLTKAWLDQHTAINKARESTVEKLKRLNDLPTDYFGFNGVVAKRNEVYKDLHRESRYAAGTVVARLNAVAFPLLREYLYTAQKLIQETGMDRLTATTHGISTIKIPCHLVDVDSVSGKLLSRYSDDLRLNEAETLQDSIAALKKAGKDAEVLVQEYAPFAQCQAVISAAQESLKTDLDQFFQNVELYRAGVFSLATKESIATLGIGAQLDALEAKFTDDDKTLLVTDAVDDLFKGFTKLTADAATHLTSLSSQISRLSEALRGLRIERPARDMHALEMVAEEEKTSFHEEVCRQLQTDVDRLCSKVASGLSKSIVECKDRFVSEMEAASKTRRSRYTIFILGSGALFLMCYVGYRFSSFPAPRSTFGTVAWGVLATVIGDVLGFVVARWRDNYPEKSKKIRERSEVLLLDQARKLIDAEFELHGFEVRNETDKAARLYQIYERIVAHGSDEWHTKAVEYHGKIKAFQTEYSSFRSSYLSFIEDIATQCAGYFKDASKNLEILTTVAARIKERAIEPSFMLLARTHQQLENVKKDIEGVDFV